MRASMEHDQRAKDNAQKVFDRTGFRTNLLDGDWNRDVRDVIYEFSLVNSKIT